MKEEIKKLLKEYHSINFPSKIHLNGYAKKILDLLSPNKTHTTAPSPIITTNAIAGQNPRRGVS